MARNVIMAKDEYYYALYRRKKEYYLNSERMSFTDGGWVKWPPFRDNRV